MGTQGLRVMLAAITNLKITKICLVQEVQQLKLSQARKMHLHTLSNSSTHRVLLQLQARLNKLRHNIMEVDSKLLHLSRSLIQTDLC